jgi:transposase
MKTIKQVIGIDVSKDDFHVCLGTIDESQIVRIVKQSSFANNAKGFKQLVTWKQKNMLKEVNLWHVMEATGVYYESLAYFLAEVNEKLTVLLPNKSKHFAKSLDIKTKTDKVDAAMLCRIGLERALPEWKIPSVLFKHIKALTREYRTLKSEASKIKTRLHAYTHSYCPEKKTMARLKKQLGFIEKQYLEVEREIKDYINQDPALKQRIQNITNVKGIGLITVITIIAETNGFASIENAKQLTSYSGLDIVMNQSGKHYGKTRISKKGNRHIRSILYMPAMCSMKTNLRFKQFYNQIMTKKECGKIAVVAVARKLLTLIYTLWKNNTVYDPLLNVKV